MNTMKAELRDPQVKAKSLRRSGQLPCCIYGAQLPESMSIQVALHEATNFLRKNGTGSKVELEVDGKKMLTLVKEIARNTLKNEVEHINFQALEADTMVSSTADIVLENRDKVPGFIAQVLFKLPYTALPADLMDTVVIDLEGMKMGSRVTVQDLPIAQNDKIQLLVEPDTVVFSIMDNKRTSDKDEDEGESTAEA